MMAVCEVREWVWNGMRVRLPGDWELVQFSKNAEVGNLVFADRYQFRVQIGWQRTKGRLDVKRTLGDELAQMQMRDPDLRGGLVREGSWNGVKVEVGEEASRYVREFRKAGLVLQVVVPKAGEGCERVEDREMLEGVGVAGEDRSGEWRAFGMQLRVQEGWTLDACRAHAGLAEMLFLGSGRECGRQSFSRRGLVKRWLRGSVEDWVELQAPMKLVEVERQEESHAGHVLYHVSGVGRERPRGQWRAKWHRWAATAWICPVDGRLYCHSRAVEGEGDLAEASLVCCRDLRKAVWHE